MEFVILLIVFGIISSVIKSAATGRGRQQQAPPRTGQADAREIFRELRERAQEAQRTVERRQQGRGQEPEAPTFYGYPSNLKKPPEPFQAEEKHYVRQSLEDYLKLHEKDYGEFAPLEVVSLDEEEERRGAAHLSFSRDALVSGILYSEILKLPKGRRL